MPAMARLAGLALTAFVAAAPVRVQAALVDAGELTSVSTAAALFDTSLGGDEDCDPGGCVGDLTRVRTPCVFRASSGKRGYGGQLADWQGTIR